MPKSYIYTYKGFPDEKADKYYVCKYGKGSPVTYQVVPQLQRIFDREGAQNKESLDWERYKQLRRDGYIYTRKRADEKRTPVYADIVADELPERWRPVAEWLGDSVAPGDVDWAEFGASVRGLMEAAPRVPEPVWKVFGRLPTPAGGTLRQDWNKLRRIHARRCWPHLWPTATLRTMAAAAPAGIDAARLVDRLERLGRGDFEGIGEASPGEIAASRFPLDALRACGVGRETRAAERLDETALRRACAREVGLDETVEWDELLADLPPEDERYESVGPETEVPGEPLYDVQWTLSKSGIDELTVSPWATVGRPGLHVRFHAGASSAVVVGMESLCPADAREWLAEQVEGRWGPSPFDDWSRAGRDAFVDLVTRDETLSPAAPTTEGVAEWLAGALDAAVRERLDEDVDDGARWRYSRSGRSLVVSSSEARSPDTLMDIRRLVCRELEASGYEVDANASRIWQREPGALHLEGLEVPAEPTGPIEIGDEDGLTVEEALEAQRAGELTGEQRRMLKQLYRRTGSLRYGTFGEPKIRRCAESIVGALVLSEFTGPALEGWLLG